MLLGPPNSGRLGGVIDWWVRHEGDEPVIVVPTQADVTTLTIELTRRVGTVLARHPVCTFAGLLRLLAPPSAPAPAGQLGEVEARVLVAQLLREMPLQALDQAAPSPGAIAAAGVLLREIAESGLAGTEAELALGRWLERGGGAAARDVRALFNAYRRRLADAGRFDSADLVQAAAAGCETWSRPVAFYGFSSFSSAQHALVRRLSQAVPVLLSLDHDPERSYRRAYDAEVDLWRGGARETIVLGRQAGVFVSPDLAYLDAAFLSTDGVTIPAPADRRPGDGGVRFLMASGRRGEVELVGEEVVRLLREGCLPDDIGVVVRSMSPWQRLIRQVFRSYAIPHRLDAETSLAETGLGSALLQGLRGLAAARLTPLLVYLRSPYTLLDHDAVDRLEVQLRRAKNTVGESMLANVEAMLPGSLSSLRRAVALTPEGRAGLSPQHVESLAWEMLAAAASEHTFDSYEMEEDVESFTAVASVARDLASSLEAGWSLGGPTSPEGTDIELTLALLAAAPVRTGRGDERGVVHVMAVPRARARRFSAVFVLGVVEGEFPQGQRPPGLLSRASRRRANEASGAVLFSEPVEGEEASLFALALSRPVKLLYLSTRDAEEDGEQAQPSPYWSEAHRLMGQPRLYRRRTLRDISHEPSQAPSLREYLRTCAEARLLPPDAANRAAIRSAPRWRCDPDRLCSPAALCRLQAISVFSATSLEKYAECPFAWFMSRLVRPEVIEEKPSGLRKGDLVHAVLADTYRALKTEGLLPLRQPSFGRAAELVEYHLQRLIEPAGDPDELAERIFLEWEVRRLARAALSLDLQRPARWTPRFVEYSLPEDGVDLGDGLRIKGRIDRVDEQPGIDSLFVVDYKSGSGAKGPRFVEDGALQVPLYMLALRRLFPEADVVGGAYLALAKARARGLVRHGFEETVAPWLPKTCTLDGEGFEAELSSALAAAHEASRGMQAGLIPAAPRGDCPAWCDFRPVCRTKNPVATWPS